jgi:lysozyme family protein
MIDRIIAREGGAKITRDPNDPGGLTKFGISQKAYPNLDIANLTYEQAKDIYIRDYYTKNNIQLLPERFQEPVLDFTVHSGPMNGVGLFQKIVGAKPDGKIGPVTLAAVNRNNPDDIIVAYRRERVTFLARQVVASPAKLKYLIGWLLRALIF